MLSLHFDKKLITEGSAYWSLTLYDLKNLKSNNSLSCLKLGEKDSLVYNKDGSLDLYVQNDHPGLAKRSNWLVPPQGQFFLVMRLFWPETLVMDFEKPDRKHSNLM